jgi:hypothetical protein
MGNVFKVKEQSTFTKFDVEDSTGVVEVKVLLDGGSDVFMAERRAACWGALFLAMSCLYSLMGKRHNNTKRTKHEATGFSRNSSLVCVF